MSQEVVGSDFGIGPLWVVAAIVSFVALLALFYGVAWIVRWMLRRRQSRKLHATPGASRSQSNDLADPDDVRSIE